MKSGGVRAFQKVGAFAAAVAGIVALFSCGDDKPDDGAGRIGVFTGRVANTNAFIGITVGKANIAAWVCDGAGGVALQFSTPRLGDGFDVTLPNGHRLAGRLDGEKLDGALSGPSGAAPFTAELARGGAGVWTASQTGDGERRRVWIVLNDGTQQGATVLASGVTAAPLLDTGTGTAGAIQAVRSNPGGTSGTQFSGGITGGARRDAGQLGFGG